MPDGARCLAGLRSDGARQAAPAQRCSDRSRPAVIGGIISSTILTRLVLPALYRMFHREHSIVPVEDATDLIEVKD